MSGNLGEPLARAHHIYGTDRDYTLGLSRTNISAHLEHNVLLKRLTLSAGFVAVKNTQADMNMTLYPGIDASLRLSDAWKLYASYNSSLRMPSFTELYYKLQGYAADPHLKPEEMQAVEVGVDYHSQALTLHASFFHHHGKNMIDWIMDTSLGEQATWQSVNHTRINSYGAEANLRLNLYELFPALSAQRPTLNVSYSYLTQDKDLEPNLVSQYALEYLRHKLVANLQTRLWRQLHLGVNARWQDRVGTYTDFSGVVQEYRPYALVDARLSWQATGYTLYAEANNVFNNKDYVDYGNVPQPGCWLVFGAKYSF